MGNGDRGGYGVVVVVLGAMAVAGGVIEVFLLELLGFNGCWC